MNTTRKLSRLKVKNILNSNGIPVEVDPWKNLSSAPFNNGLRVLVQTTGKRHIPSHITVLATVYAPKVGRLAAAFKMAKNIAAITGIQTRYDAVGCLTSGIVQPKP